MLNDTSRVTQGTSRQIRVRAKVRDVDAWLGVAFGVESSDKLYRVVYRPVDSCLELQRRAAQTENLSSGVDSFAADQEVEVRVTYGNGSVSVVLFDTDEWSMIGDGFSHNVAELTDASMLSPLVAVYSSNSRNGVVISALQVIDVDELSNVVEPTAAPTPLPVFFFHFFLFSYFN